VRKGGALTAERLDGLAVSPYSLLMSQYSKHFNDKGNP